MAKKIKMVKLAVVFKLNDGTVRQVDLSKAEADCIYSTIILMHKPVIRVLDKVLESIELT